MKLYIVTKHDDHRGESQEQLNQNSDVEKLKNIGNEYAKVKRCGKHFLAIDRFANYWRP